MPGRYLRPLAASFPAVPLLGASLLAGACARAERPELPADTSAVVVDGITYRAVTRQLETFPVTLQTTATVTNTTDRLREITFPNGCVVLLRAYGSAARTGRPAWDQERAVACTQQLVVARLDPGHAEEYRTSASAAEILGDSLPAGRYHFTAVLRPNGRVVEVPAGMAELRK